MVVVPSVRKVKKKTRTCSSRYALLGSGQHCENTDEGRRRMIDLEQVSCSFYGDDTQVINKAIYLYQGVTLSASFLSFFSSPADYDRVNKEIDETTSWKDRVRTCSS